MVLLILEYWDTFSFNGEFGQCDLIQHDIFTTPNPPINQRVRPVNPALEPNLRRQIDEWLDQKVIEPSSSPWNFALVPVAKKNGKTRWCVDYRPLNAITLKDPHPLGTIDDNLARLSRSKYFSTCDGAGAFHVINLSPTAKLKTAFSTPWGHFQFRRLPFGLANGPATYARLVHLVLRGIPQSVAIPYLDDTIVHSRTIPEHFHGPVSYTHLTLPTKA